ncbi:MAG: hypothetical protein ACYCW6_15520 [Candidatus Xenobia bacterium]
MSTSQSSPLTTFHRIAIAAILIAVGLLAGSSVPAYRTIALCLAVIVARIAVSGLRTWLLRQHQEPRQIRRICGLVSFMIIVPQLLLIVPYPLWHQCLPDGVALLFTVGSDVV